MSSLPTRVVVTPSALPMLNRGRDGATGVLFEAGIPPKRSGVRCNSSGVAAAEGARLGRQRAGRSRFGGTGRLRCLFSRLRSE